ncbi:hypothetical protein HC723_16360 [Vibrio sp. S11_S32]|uniref:AfsA-related hotdog domain-containing protein n=1 Tax=Vibrio sp. S11_S32 TaxID=2720225 RepID=UPI001680F7EA|nr:AfsA-related hotdog domain-containing protein [Vibrio sp. S11_S32]MBD1577964.1 hypothetical protein [Vibrio sp. S11_S32]
MSINNFYTVVGDDFKLFAKKNKAVTFSNLELLLEKNQIDTLNLGQGLSKSELVKINEISSVKLLNEYNQIPKGLVHKTNDVNTLISDVIKIGEDSFSFGVQIYKGNEFLLDHITGIHINGTLIIEAARQALVSVLESHYGDVSIGSRFILNSFKTEFISYVYPIAINGNINIFKTSENKISTTFSSTVLIKQLDNICVKANIDCSLTKESIANLNEHLSSPKL